MYALFFKRFLDILIALVLIFLFLPLGVVIAILLIIITADNPFFVQKRVGKNEKIFGVLKFKTMNDLRDGSGKLLNDSDRTTRIGKILRKCSLDELPQLVNVLIGDMSLIGPRPLLIRYLPYYTLTEKKRHSVRPGISGWAQINGRNNTNWETRLNFDVQYVENISFKLDSIIVCKTVLYIILAKDVEINKDAALLELCEERKPYLNEK